MALPRIRSEPIELHPGKFVRVLMQNWSTAGYCDEVIVLPEGRFARLAARYVAWQDSPKVRRWIAEDGRACGMQNGDYFRWWTLGYWLFRPVMFLHWLGTPIESGFIRAMAQFRKSNNRSF